MKLQRDTALKIHYVMDQWIPPWFRDQRWFMSIPMRLAFGSAASTYLDFRQRAFTMSEDEFRETYRRVSNVAVSRATDLNRSSIRRVLEEVRGPKVLEVGCGKGFLAGLLAQNSALEVTAVDLVVDEAVKKMPALAAWREANIEDLPFEDSFFDTVICTHTLEHVRNLSRGVAELRRVGKRMVVIVPRQRPYKYTFDLHLNFFPYPHSLLAALGKTPADGVCEDVDGDLMYVEVQQDVDSSSRKEEYSTALIHS